MLQQKHHYLSKFFIKKSGTRYPVTSIEIVRIEKAHEDKIALANDGIANHQFLQSRNREIKFCNPSSWPSGTHFCGHDAVPPNRNVNENARVQTNLVSTKHNPPPKEFILLSWLC